MDQVQTLLTALGGICNMRGIEWKFLDTSSSSGKASISLELTHKGNNYSLNYKRDKDSAFSEWEVINFIHMALAEVISTAINLSKLKTSVHLI